MNKGNLFIELRIEELRKQHKLTLTALAKLSGVGISTLSEIKLGIKRTISYDQERKLAKTFGVTVPELYKEKVEW